MRRFALSGNLSFSLAKSPRRFFYHFLCRRVLHSRQFSLWLLSSLRCNLKQLTQWDGTIVQRAAASGYFKCLLYISMYFHSRQLPWTLRFRYSFWGRWEWESARESQGRFWVNVDNDWRDVEALFVALRCLNQMLTISWHWHRVLKF